MAAQPDAELVLSTQPFRRAEGGLIDRARKLRFNFDGQEFTGCQGDTLASALLANGVRLVGRSFKYHRPRGILSAGPEEPNALAELRRGARREPNTRMTTTELFEGLAAESQNRFPSLRYDLLSVNGLFGSVLAAGFYYKTFMWPAAFWEKLYEPLIRRAAGLGRAAGAEDPDSYEKANAFCDVLVIGAGAAGLAAALMAGRAGARVILCDEDFEVGGRLLSEKRVIDGVASQHWARAAEAEFSALPEARLMRRTTVFGVYDGKTYGALERVSDHLAEPPPHQPRQRFWRIVAKRAILATGAIERPLVFGANDRPGVMLAAALRAYLNRYAVRPGQRAVVFGNNDDAARTVADLAESGVEVAALVDPRASLPALTVEAASRTGTRLLTGAAVLETLGGRTLQGVIVKLADGSTLRLDCDLLAMSGGWTPSLHLSTHLGGKPVWNEAKSAFLPGTLPPGMDVVGAAAGEWSLAGCLAEGARAGSAAAAHCGFPRCPVANYQTDEEATGSAPLWHVPGRKKAFVDFQNDVTAADISLAATENFRSVEHLKRYTTLGMATDQGKTSNVNGLAIMAAITEKTMSETGTTKFRPPYTPVAIAAFAGHHRGADFRPTRLTPTHAWAQANGAVFVDAGAWKRAQYFPKPGETDWLETVNREVLAVRSGVGFCDVTTLGKIDIQGADAAAFLDRVYANHFSSLAIGRARYGLMLREDGFVFDDGTTARLGPDHYVMTTTTANAGRVLQHLEFCAQWLWPSYDVHLVSVTEQWAQLALAGPRARDVLRKLVDSDTDISNEAFPYMAAARVTLCGGLEARLFRLSFSGELAYEIAVPASYGTALAERLMQAGQEFGILPYGTEALGVMRVEKGHPAGAELNGQTTADDLGMGRLLSKKKDFVGAAMARRAALTDRARPTLIGVRPLDPAVRLRAGAHFLPRDTAATAAHDQGYLTSVAFSPTLDHWIGLGFVAHGPARLGEILRAYDPVRNGDVPVEIVRPVFIDPEGKKLHG